MNSKFEMQLHSLMNKILTIERRFLSLLKNVLFISFSLVLFSGSLALGAQQSERKKILVLYSFRPTLPVATQWDRGIRSVFENNEAIHSVIDIEHLDLTHFDDKQHVNTLLDLYRHKYTNPKPDLIIPVLNSSVDLMLKYGEELFPGVPIVFGGVESKFIGSRKLRSNITGHLTEIDFEGTLDLALNIHKDTRNVVVVGGAGQVVRKWVDSCRKAYKAYEDRYEFTFLIGLSMENLLEEVKKLPPQTIVISLPVLVDGEGKKFVGIESLALISQASTAPLYTFWDASMGAGMVGGHVISFEKEGKAVADLGLRILNGEKPQAIPISKATKYSYMFDWRQLKRWSIPERKLPPESMVMFKDITIWDEYKGGIISGIAMILMQTFIIVYLLHQRKRRHQAEEEVKQSELRYRTVAEYTYDWEYWISADGKLEYVSPSCERISGYSTNDFSGNPSLLRDIIVKEDRDIWDDYNERLHKELKPSEIQFRIHRQDGAIRWIEHVSQTVPDHKGAHSGYRVSNRDISIRKTSELEIENLKNKLQAESAYLQDEIKLANDFEHIIGKSEELKYVLHQSELVSSTDSSVLILGETGTGKELIARAIHKLSSRSSRALIKVNCAALPPNLIESELFGREKGAYTGADNLQIGRFEIAADSSIFLDEIGEIPLEVQAKLLQILESGEFERLGNPKTHQSDARVIAATNRDLKDEVSKGGFRKDLLYRLNVFTITLPPLRKRTEDIPMLVQWFIEHYARKMGKPALQVSKKTMAALQQYKWPGNVRELKHTIERAMITNRDEKLTFDLPSSSENLTGSIKTYQEMERDYILDVLKTKNWKIGGNDSVASVLDIHVNTLRSKMKKLGITTPKKS